jgi:F-type H+-transporting ATPase subunit b
MGLASIAAVFAETDTNSGIGINAGAFISQLISFLVVLFILSKFVWPTVIRTLDKRQATIKEGIENAERAKQALIEAGNRAEEVLAQARRDAQATIERASRNAEKVAHQIEADARVRAEQFSQQQMERIQQETNRARMELSRQVVNLSIEAASKVISRSVDNKDNRRLVQEFVTASDTSRNN